jgi:ApaG protein
MFSAVTGFIIVTVEASYQAAESDPDAHRYVWSYRVVIENRGDRPMQLLRRHWNITDGNGAVRDVSGVGVVGQQPVIEPGEAFEYTSGCPLTTPSGIMVGSYRMADDRGGVLDVAIPAFSLDIPGVVRLLN